MNQQDFVVRTADQEELQLMVEWAAVEGWNPGLDDAACFHQADPNGFLLGWLGDEPIASISVVKYAAAFGFLGFYIVKPEYRGQGFGLRTWQAGMDYLSGCNVGLDGVVDQQGNYKKSGFKLAYNNIRYQGKAFHGEPTLGAEISSLTEADFVEVLSYDQEFFPVERESFLRCWLSPPRIALGYFKDHMLQGYGVLRACRSGFKIGPLFADSPAIADTLFVALQGNATEGSPVFLDIPDGNPSALALVTRYGMQPVFETARMYTKQAPDLPINRLFGVTTFELG